MYAMNNELTQHMTTVSVTASTSYNIVQVCSAVITCKSSDTELCTLQSEGDGMEQRKIE